MPKLSKREYDRQTNPDAEEYAPHRREMRNDSREQEQAEQLWFEIYRELGKRHIRRPTEKSAGSLGNPFVLFEERKDQIEHPEELFHWFSDLKRRIKRLRDKTVREDLIKRTQGFEERIVSQYQPFVEQWVDEIGSELYRLAEKQQSSKEQLWIQRQVARLREDIEDAKLMMGQWGIEADRRVMLEADFEAELQHLDEYLREPYLWGFEDAEIAFFQALQDEYIAMAVDRERRVPRLSAPTQAPDSFDKIRRHLNALMTTLHRMSDQKISTHCQYRYERSRLMFEDIQRNKEEQEKPAFLVEGSPAWAYVVLGVYQEQSLDEIRAVFRRLVLELHPDRVPEVDRAASAERMKEVNRAYSLIKKMKEQQSEDHLSQHQAPSR